MIEIYKNELEKKLENVEFNNKPTHFHNISRKDLISMYKIFYETNNCISLSEDDILVDNLAFALYENWLVGSDEY